MTRKDYELIAKAIKKSITEDAPTPGQISGTNTTAINIADALMFDNPAFNRVKFLVACGFGSLNS